MKNISLPQIIKCSDKSLAYARINCTHWDLNTKGECTPKCKLKNKDIKFSECQSCDVRNPIEDDNIRFKSMAHQMRERIPQANYYNKQKLSEEKKKTMEQDKSFLEKAAQYAKTEGSQLIEGKVSEEIFEKRKSLCMECPRRMNPTPETEPIGWCATCGCSAKNPRAALSNKLWMPDLVCPLNKFPQETGQGFNVGDAVNSVKGAIQSVASLFKSDGNT
jgi:hypothetical protein